MFILIGAPNKQFQAAPNFFSCPPNISDRPLWFFYACGDSTQILTALPGKKFPNW